MEQDYGKTLNLPQTDYPMRGNLPSREPDSIVSWQENKIYEKMVEQNKGKQSFILHDGPPYANGNIHLGTTLNKVLKDIIVKYKNMSGYYAPFIPGWDTHGLPIELKAMKALGLENMGDPVLLRKHCEKFAQGCQEEQKKQFVRLGVLADYDNPYLTFQNDFEAKQIEVFGEMANRGYIYKGLKPVYWCADCHTALAEAEIEYEDDPCYSIYVKFYLSETQGKLDKLAIDKDKVSFLIWTTTTWTLPGNVGICIGKDYTYGVVKVGEEYLIIAEELIQEVMKVTKEENYEIVGTFLGKELEGIQCKHPFLDRTSEVILGEHVNLESGTGCVHTAPGHGVEDYEVVVQNYSHLPLIVPVDDKGILTEEAGEFQGLAVIGNQAGSAIAQKLKETNHLFATEKIKHQYPHCWRCHNPILFRATKQWFCSIEGFKKEALEGVKSVKWNPSWGEERMLSMIEDRSDWCISRQRVWGVPIPIFYCNDCGEYHINEASTKAVADMFRKEGSNSWYIRSAEEILPKNTVCAHCKGVSFHKETDIMDVWFDSGVSHTAVLEQREGVSWPADLYLEGNDQYRGWFQSSLLTAMAYKGKAPYKMVCTHGWVVDGSGRKMSKSIGNGIEPEEIIKEYGADILRLWVASSDYHNDIKISKEILKQLTESYRKIRNTARYILGNLNNFDPDVDMVEIENLEEIDHYALMKLNELIEKVDSGYHHLEFHTVYQSIHNFCVVDMSNFYLDIIKDRLYVEGITSQRRRKAQTTIYHILSSLARLVAPILAFTSQEIWSHMPKVKKEDHVLFHPMPTVFDLGKNKEFKEIWEKRVGLYTEINKGLELARQEKIIGSSLEAKAILFIEEEETYTHLVKEKEILREICIVSQLEIRKGTGEGLKLENLKATIAIEKAEGNKCDRCWVYTKDVGTIEEHSQLCHRCGTLLSK